MGNWLDQYTQEEIESMPVVIVDCKWGEGFPKMRFRNYAHAEDVLHRPFPLMANREMMSAMRDIDKDGGPLLRFETASAYRELGK